MFGILPWEVERLRPDELEEMEASLAAQAPETEEAVSMDDALAAAAEFDEDALPDPFRAPPPGLGGP